MIEPHVTSLDLSKRLCELGVLQNSLFYYQNNPYNDGTDCIDLMINQKKSKNNENTIMNTECENDDHPKYSAFLASELLELLPEKTKYGALKLIVNGDYVVSYYDGCDQFGIPSDNLIIYDKNPCNALAKMLIHLIETGLIKAEDLK